MKKTKLPTKHKFKKLTDAQEDIVRKIAEKKNCPWQMAKHIYFENQEKYDDELPRHPGLTPDIEKRMEAEAIARQSEAEAMKDDKPEKKKDTVTYEGPFEEPRKKKGSMTISETKLGVTLVISKEDCVKMGFSPEQTTKEVIQAVKRRLNPGNDELNKLRHFRDTAIGLWATDRPEKIPGNAMEHFWELKEK